VTKHIKEGEMVEKHDNPVQALVSETVLKEVTARASREGISVSAWVRRLILIEVERKEGG
jgi:predicted DNA binding CopG/RHH family protein